MVLLLGTALSASISCFAIEQEIDLTTDNFNVFTHLADKYIATHIKLQPFIKKSTFGMSYTSFDENVFPKVGFIGYQYTDSHEKDSLVKLQLFKSAKGWAVVNILDNDKIDKANPTYTYKTDHVRNKQSGKVKVATAQESEAWFNQQGIIHNVRSTSISCYVTKDSSKASCHTIYGLKDDGKVSCFSKSYLMAREQDIWKMIKEINYDQKVSYSSGELKVIKPFSKRCS
tara:strand:- start:158 stop:844 length:687 start_codon:yes stop_codon:yes gene_type:complete